MDYAADSTLRRHRLRSCPACNRPALVRVHRSEAERVEQPDQHRYLCTEDGCNWTGLLPAPSPPLRWRLERPTSIVVKVRKAPRDRDTAARRWAARHPTMLAALALMAGMVLAIGSTLLWRVVTQPVQQRQWSPGDHDEGQPLSPTHPLLRPVVWQGDDAEGAADGEANEALSYRQHCVWGKPGRSPYKGTPEQAMRAARLPPEVIKRVAQRIATGRTGERLVIANDGIRGVTSGRIFDQRHVALTYAKTLCVDARVNFPVGHTEPASLFEAVGDDGRAYAVMVPDVCGNVSVLSEAGERRPKHLVLTADADVPVNARRGLPLELTNDDEPLGFVASLQRTFNVPEPGTLPGVLAALAALWWVRRRR